MMSNECIRFFRAIQNKHFEEKIMERQLRGKKGTIPAENERNEAVDRTITARNHV